MSSFTRREFCSEYLKLLLAGATLPGLALRSVFAQASPASPKHLVVIQLFGGNDGLNTLVPLRNPQYQRNRPHLAVAANQCYRLSDDYGLHPALAEVNALWEQGNVALVQGVGHTLRDRSHFLSTSIWETADLGASPDAGTGWLGRYLDSMHLPSTAPALGLTAGVSIPQSFTSDGAPVSAIDDINAFIFQTDPLYAGDRPFLLSALQSVLNQQPQESPDQQFVRQAAAATIRDVNTYQQLNSTYRPAVSYPGSDLAGRMQLIAKVITGGGPAHVHFAVQASYDQHAGLLRDHPKRLTELSGALGAFCADLKAHGVFQDVLIFTFSEFGRRVAENASMGTDHGHGSMLFVLGGALKGGLYGTYPSLEPADLVDGDLVQTVDFRSVYATVLDRWLGADPDALLGGRFDRLGFL